MYYTDSDTESDFTNSDSISDSEELTNISDDEFLYYDAAPKKCSLCKRIPRNDLYKGSGKCYMCYKLEQYAHALNNETTKEKQLSTSNKTDKICTICKKPPTDGIFYARTRHCLPCNKIYSAEHYQKQKMKQNKDPTQ